jgi:two-component system, cell cycle sensor histidine kinase and response regulator CckA
MAKKQNSAISELHKGRYTPIQNPRTKLVRASEAVKAKITERKRTEKALLNAAQQWRATFDGLSNIVCLLDPEGRIIKCNKAMTDFLGKPFGEIINRTHLEILHGAPMLIEECPVERLWKTHRRETDILLINDRWFSIAVDPLLDEAGGLVGAVHIMSDVTELKRTEEAIRESEKRYRQVIENAVDIIYTTDANGNFTHANSAALTTTGYSLEELQRFNYLNLILPEHRDRVSKIYISQFRQRQATTYVEFPFFNKSGDVLWFGQNASLVVEGENSVGFHVIARDITERKRVEQTLQETEERYKALYDRSLDCIFVLDFEGKFIDANQAALALLGYERTDISSLNIASLLDERYLSKGLQDINEIVQTGFQKEISEYRLKRKDGGAVYVETQGSMIYRYGKPHSIQGIARDITERKQAGEALRQSEEKYRNILDSIQDGYSEIDLRGNFTFVNDMTCKHLGYTKQELIGMNYHQYTSEEDAKKIKKLYTEVYKTGKPIDLTDHDLISKDGTTATYELSVSLIRNAEGNPIGFRQTSRDITQRKKSEEALRQSEERYRNILESIQEGYFETDLDGTYTFVNDANARFLGYTKDELVGMNHRQHSDQETIEELGTRYTDLYQTGKPIEGLEVQSIRKNGSKAIYETSVSLIRNSEGKPIGFRGVSRDITERKRAEEALRQSEEKYRNILERIEEGYYEEDLAGNFTFFNDSVSRIYGYPRGELLGLNYKRYMDKETARKLFQIFNEIFRTGNPCSAYDYELIRKDGTKRYIEASASLIKDSSNKPAGFRGIVRDVTERKRTEEALRESENKFRSLVENSIVGVYLVQDGLFKYVNPRGAEIHGYKLEEMIDKMGPKQLTFPEDWPIVEENIGKKIRGEEEFTHYEFRIVTKSQETRNVELFSSPTIYQGRPAVLGTMLDITERKRAEEALRSSEERYRSILESIQDGYFEDDLAGNFTFVNDVISRHLGYTKDELIGMNYRQYASEETSKELYQHFSELYRTGQPIKPFAVEYIRRDRTKMISEISVSLIRDLEGKQIGFRGISRDVTERKQAEEEKLSLQEQLRQAQKMEAIGQLAGGVAHDFNNLLTVIKGYSQLSLLDLKEDSPLWGNIQEIEKASQRATDLTRQLLAFSRRQILDLKVLDLNVLLKDLEKMLRRIIGEDIALVTLLSEGLGKVKVDPGQIEQVIFNLAVNARDAMPSGGKLSIETANAELDEEYARSHVNVAPGRYVRLSVSDTGVGMTQEVKDRVFEPFFTTKEKGKGTGLGLSMVYGIVKQSGGNIWLYSEPGRGTTFRVYFPRTEEEADGLHKEEVTDVFPRGSETILLVEDDELVRDLATRLLEQQGYRVLKATNGQEALRVAREHVGETIHLLLSDIVMPQMGGKELSDWLKISRPNVKVLYTSGYADNAIVHQGVLDPGTHFLQKPFSLKTLSHKVREVLDE